MKWSIGREYGKRKITIIGYDDELTDDITLEIIGFIGKYNKHDGN